jgi:hypothetical protein
MNSLDNFTTDGSDHNSQDAMPADQLGSARENRRVKRSSAVNRYRFVINRLGGRQLRSQPQDMLVRRKRSVGSTRARLNQELPVLPVYFTAQVFLQKVPY